jgi:hypothetical protein
VLTTAAAPRDEYTVPGDKPMTKREKELVDNMNDYYSSLKEKK